MSPDFLDTGCCFLPGRLIAGNAESRRSKTMSRDRRMRAVLQLAIGSEEPDGKVAIRSSTLAEKRSMRNVQTAGNRQHLVRIDLVRVEHDASRTARVDLICKGVDEEGCNHFSNLAVGRNKPAQFRHHPVLAFHHQASCRNFAPWGWLVPAHVCLTFPKFAKLSGHFGTM